METKEIEEKTQNVLNKSVESYKKAVNDVYNKKLENTVNLINGCVREEQNGIVDQEYAREFFKNAVYKITKVPEWFVDSVNSVANTTHTDSDFNKILEKYSAQIEKDLLNYFDATFSEKQKKRKPTNAQEMRKEMDEAKDAIEELLHPKNKEKLTFWQKVKKFFGCK